MGTARYSLRKDVVGPATLDGDVEKVQISFLTYAKRHRGNRFLVPNELLACRLGEAIGVPVASGIPIAVHSTSSESGFEDDVYWGSLSVREEPPPADCEELVRRDLDTATGIIVFDAWICNIDRNELNLVFDVVDYSVALFDHAEAICNRIGPEFLEQKRDTLGFDSIHAVAECLTNFTYLDKWLNQLGSIGTQFIATAVKATTSEHLTGEEQRKLVYELDRRRRTLPELFERDATARSIFPSIQKQDTLFKPVDYRDATTDYQI